MTDDNNLRIVRQNLQGMLFDLMAEVSGPGDDKEQSRHAAGLQDRSVDDGDDHESECEAVRDRGDPQAQAVA